MGTKTCTKCGNTYPATAEYFSKNGSGLRTYCKQCQREYMREYYATNAEKLAEKRREYYATNAEKRREYSREYYTANAEKLAEKRREYYTANAEKRREYSREYYTANAEKKRQYRAANAEKQREYRAANAEKAREYRREYYATNAEKLAEKYREYRQTPRGREVACAASHRSRARKRQLRHDFTPEQWNTALEYFDHKCAVCGEPLTGLFHQPARDHWIPTTRGGDYTATNIVPICNIRAGVSGVSLGKPACNQSKLNRDPHEWLVAEFGAKKAKQIEARIEAYFASLQQ